MALTPLEIHEISQLIEFNNVRKLGYHLGFEHNQVQRYELINNRNPSPCTGTGDMLMTWYSKGGSREQLCEALRRVEQGRLAHRVEKGDFKVEPVAVPKHPHAEQCHELEANLHGVSPAAGGNCNLSETGTVASRVNIEMVLPKLAQDIEQDQLTPLGLALKFRTAQINRFSSTNYLSGRVSTQGTLDMLYEWRGGTSPANEKPELRAALVSAGLVHLADEYLPLES